MSCFRSFTLILVAGVLAPSVGRAQGPGFRSDRWVLADTAARVVSHLGRESLYLRTGTAYLRDVVLQDGEIEVLVSAAAPRGFAAVVFRVQSPGELEEIYLRLHKSGSPDAIQYTPRFRGLNAWQLYSGPGFTAPVTFEPAGWTHLRVRVEGSEARVYVNGAEEPTLVVTDLKRDITAGSVGVWALNGAYFADFRYQPLPPAPVTEKAGQPSLPGLLTQWEISQSFPAEEVDLQRYPETAGASGLRWERVESERSGIVNLGRFRGKARAAQDGSANSGVANSTDVVYARTTIHAEHEQVAQLAFGYSDRVTLFLNGRPLYSGNSSFRSRDPLFLGIVGLHDTVYLNLRPGENEILFAVEDRDGGWGFLAQARMPGAAADAVEP